MSEKAKSSETKSDEGQAHDIQVDTYNPIADQGLEAIDEKLLMGEEIQTPEEKEAAEKEAAEKEAAEKEAAEKEAAEKEAAEKEAAEKKVAEKKIEKEAIEKKGKKKETPPEGYVSLKAVQEARDENRFLKGQMSKLEQQVTDLTKAVSEKSTKPKEVEDPLAEFKDFKELSLKDFKELVKDDPTEGLIYTQTLQAYKEAKQKVKEQKISESTQELEAAEKIFDETSRLMEEYVPGIFDEKTTTAKDIADFASTLGFTPDMFYLTNPETRVIFPGAKEPVYLGTQAASMLKTLAQAKNKTSVNEKEVRKEIRDELTETIRKEVTEQLMSKFKTDPESFRSLSAISDTTSEHAQSKFAGKVLSTSEYQKLSEADKELYLSGA